MKTSRSRFLALAQPGTTCTFQADWCPTPTVRTVVERFSRKLTLTHPTKDGVSWLDFPKASEITEPTPGVFLIAPEGYTGQPLRYDFNV